MNRMLLVIIFVTGHLLLSIDQLVAQTLAFAYAQQTPAGDVDRIRSMTYRFQFPHAYGSPDFIASFGLSYERYQVDRNVTLADFSDKALTTLQRFSLELAGFYRLSDTEGIGGTFYPGVYFGDFGELSGQDKGMEMAVFYRHHFAPRKRLDAGLILSRNVGQPLPLPYFHVTWALPKDTTFELYVPEFLRLSVQYQPTIRLGLEARLDGDQYRMGRKSQDSPLFVRYVNAAIGPFVTFDLASWLQLEVIGSYVGYQSWVLFDDDFEKIAELDLDPAWQIQGRLQLKGI